MNGPQNIIDRMLEVENLTDTLEDDDADFLLNWGVAQLKGRLISINDSDAAGKYTNELIGFMRTVNQIAGDLENIQPDKLAQLAEFRQKALGPGQALGAETYGEALDRLGTMTPRQALEYLLQINLKER